MQEFTVPPPAEPGDEVAIVAPASGAAATYEHVYETGLERIRDVFGLEPVEYPTARKDGEWLYDNPEARAEDVMDAFEDPEISAVITTIGGNDQIRILEHLDPERLRENPTRFFGYSDNTNLALYLWNLGIVSFYGGCVLTEYANNVAMFDYEVEYLERALFEESFGAVRPAEFFTDSRPDWNDEDCLERPRDLRQSTGRTWAGGTDPVEGRVWGGCYETLVGRLLAGRYLPDPSTLDGAILALETSEEVPGPARVYGDLMALGERGLLERFDGVLVGRAQTQRHDLERSREEQTAYREAQRTVVTDVLEEYNPDAPVVFDLEFGHTNPSVPIPVGGRVRIDPREETVVFD